MGNKQKEKFQKSNYKLDFILPKNLPFMLVVALEEFRGHFQPS